MTLHERLVEARGVLAAAGIAQTEAAIDVDLYARTILGWDRAKLLVARQAAQAALDAGDSKGAQTYLSELIWRKLT